MDIVQCYSNPKNLLFKLNCKDGELYFPLKLLKYSSKTINNMFKDCGSNKTINESKDYGQLDLSSFEIQYVSLLLDFLLIRNISTTNLQEIEALFIIANFLEIENNIKDELIDRIYNKFIDDNEISNDKFEEIFNSENFSYSYDFTLKIIRSLSNKK